MPGEVIATTRLTSNMIRVVLGGDGLAGFEPTPHTDQYVNALFIPDGAPYDGPFDVEAAKAGPSEHRPRGRRYTIRSWYPVARQLTIDFVVHGDVGYAGRWATRAQPGDRLQFLGPSGGYAPDPEADWYFMAGDESALPAIAASLERVRPGAPAQVVVVVDGPDGELALDSPGDLTVHWVHRTHADGDVTRVVDAVAAIDFGPGRCDVFVHGEAAEIRAVRRHLVAACGIDAAGASISPYWRRGETDEAWRQHKAAFVAAMNADA